MKNLIIEGTKSSPEILFDPTNHILKIRGQSYPENAFKFYEPILAWVEEYLHGLTAEVKVEIDFLLPYINTSSSKCIMMILEKFEEAHEEGKKIKLTWYYNLNNESELECAEEFQEEFSFPFYIMSRENE